MKKALLVTSLSIMAIISSGVAGFVYSGSLPEEANVMVVVASYNNFISDENGSLEVNGKFELTIGEEIDTYCSIRATRVNNGDDLALIECLGTYCFEWDSAFDSYLTIDGYQGDLKDGISIDSPAIAWKESMRPMGAKQRQKAIDALKGKEIRITFVALR